MTDDEWNELSAPGTPEQRRNAGDAARRLANEMQAELDRRLTQRARFTYGPAAVTVSPEAAREVEGGMRLAGNRAAELAAILAEAEARHVVADLARREPRRVETPPTVVQRLSSGAWRVCGGSVAQRQVTGTAFLDAVGDLMRRGYAFTRAAGACRLPAGDWFDVTDQELAAMEIRAASRRTTFDDAAASVARFGDAVRGVGSVIGRAVAGPRLDVIYGLDMAEGAQSRVTISPPTRYASNEPPAPPPVVIVGGRRTITFSDEE